MKNIGIVTILMVVAVLSFASAAVAVNAPILTGTYSLSLTENCQSKLSRSINSTAADLSSVNSLEKGKRSEAVGTLSFDPQSQTVRLEDHAYLASLLIVLEEGGLPVAPQISAATGAYSNTATDVTILSNTYQVVYANIVNSVAKHFTFVGTVSPGCITQGTAMRQ